MRTMRRSWSWISHPNRIGGMPFLRWLFYCKPGPRRYHDPDQAWTPMETLAPVDLDVAQIQRVVERTGGCVVWGGAVGLSPADDILIRVERPLDPVSYTH